MLITEKELTADVDKYIDMAGEGSIIRVSREDGRIIVIRPTSERREELIREGKLKEEK